ncbi:ligase-associated DNA damage response endonuclease PdeM [Pseudaminobacter sp. 19-2017]|uniref:Ligase-associated DNA damage response endonuclease PdeM n=1 Tax=Pseudaminobacter soli (ex Zhang et al. 2022) TaxID=2831468 RepID=A0A942I962_9HYPH|nr:ligase-associated DNA damage response endonuclease PdeM [Pseudaminobacter soli]MBS3650030.1 ligase-associated DNA damage response endonuclease PdeM [Pseudaminobacter soli]
MDGVIEIAGEAAICDRRGALFFPELSLLAVSDLHLEKGSSAARRGSMLPPYDTAVTLSCLRSVLDDFSPKVVVSLGDSFHDGQASARMPELFRAALAAMMAGRDWFWVSGNHDPDPPEGVGGESVREISLGSIRFRHEPSKSEAKGEIAGHLHPGARIVQRGRSIRRRCFATDGSRMIMPAFGSYTGSLNVLDRAFAGLFRSDGLIAHMLGTDRTYPIAGTMLRPG